MLEKIIANDQIEILEQGQIQVRQVTKIMEDGIEVARTYHRHVLSPGDVVAGQAARVAAVAKAVWTPEVVTAYRARTAAITAKR